MKRRAEPLVSRFRRRKGTVWALLGAFVLSAVPPSPALAQGKAGDNDGAKPAGIPALSRKIARHLDDPCLRRGRIGIRAYSLLSRKVLYDLRGDELFIPASNVKVLTTAAAFHYLKPDYKFSTHVYYVGRLSPAGVLDGNLYLKGFGDPSLVSEELWNLVRALKRAGLREVRGDLVIDDTYFDPELFVPGTNSANGLKPYQAPHGAASLNFNTLGLYVEPGEAGQPPRAVVDPNSTFVQLINRAKTVSRRQKGTLRVHRAAHADGDRIILDGRIREGSRPQIFWVSITAPSLYLGHTFTEFLQWQGVTVKGGVLKGKVPARAHDLAKHTSKPLSIILWDLNKWSNNFIAEQVLKTMGAEIMGAPGTRKKGLAVVERYMKQLGYRPGSYEIADGAGLSRENRIAPAQLVRILTHMYDDFRYRPEFLASLPVMGVDGNLRKRLDDTMAERRIRAKTGTLQGVDAITGYAFSQDGDIVAFSILMNGGGCSHWRMRQLQDRITLEMVRLDRRDVTRKKSQKPAR